jgi:hypothetical protein
MWVAAWLMWITPKSVFGLMSWVIKLDVEL